MPRKRQDRYDSLQDKLDEIQEQRKKEWEAFAEDPSLPVPAETDCDCLHDVSSRMMHAIEEHSEEEEPATPNIAPEVENTWFGQGSGYDVSLRSTQTGKHYGGRPTTYATPRGSRSTPRYAFMDNNRSTITDSPPESRHQSEARRHMRLRDQLSSTFQPLDTPTEAEDSVVTTQQSPNQAEQSRSHRNDHDLEDTSVGNNTISSSAYQWLNPSARSSNAFPAFNTANQFQEGQPSTFDSLSAPTIRSSGRLPGPGMTSKLNEIRAQYPQAVVQPPPPSQSRYRSLLPRPAQNAAFPDPTVPNPVQQNTMLHGPSLPTSLLRTRIFNPSTALHGSTQHFATPPAPAFGPGRTDDGDNADSEEAALASQPPLSGTGGMTRFFDRGVRDYQASCAQCWDARPRKTCRGSQPSFDVPCRRCRLNGFHCEPKLFD